jgi:sister-chromatid-cohesion protein PDS5
LENICSVLQSCIEETSELDSELLDVLLAPLLPTSKTDNPVAYKIIESVFRHVAAHIEPSLSKYLNQILIGANIGETPEIAENVYPIIYELHKMSPELLNRVVPNICLQLETDDEEVRIRAVKLVGRLFASKYANYGLDFSKNFKEFLTHFGDVSVDVRVEMVETGALIMNKQPHLFALVEGV